MLPKKFRLNIASFYSNRQPVKKYTTGILSLLMKSAINRSIVAVSVPKSLDKRSSYRNRTKRIIIDGMQKKLPDIKTPVEILIKSKKILKKEERLMVEKEIDGLLRKAGIL